MLEANSSYPVLQPLMTGKELAEVMRYEGGVTSAFRIFLQNLGIRPVPGRVDIYDPRLVRYRLDVAQGILTPAANSSGEPVVSETQKRRARRGKV